MSPRLCIFEGAHAVQMSRPQAYGLESETPARDSSDICEAIHHFFDEVVSEECLRAALR
jgi:hypothetical protein